MRKRFAFQMRRNVLIKIYGRAYQKEKLEKVRRKNIFSFSYAIFSLLDGCIRNNIERGKATFSPENGFLNFINKGMRKCPPRNRFKILLSTRKLVAGWVYRVVDEIR